MHARARCHSNLTSRSPPRKVHVQRTPIAAGVSSLLRIRFHVLALSAPGAQSFQIGGERRACASIGRADPAAFETVPAPWRIHSPMKFGGEQWFCPTDPEVRAGFQPVAALCGFTLHKLAEARGYAPQRHEAALTASNGCRHACPISPPKVSATGFAPASFRLEGGGLSFSATRSNWWVRPDLHRHYSAFEARLTSYCRRTRRKNDPPAGTCTLISAFAEPCDGCFTTGGKKEPNYVRLR